MYRVVCLFVVALALARPTLAKPISLKGSTNATAPFQAAVAKLREAGLEIAVDPDSNTSLAIASVSEGSSDLAVATRPVSNEERAAYPGLRLEESPVGVQLLALVVSADVWAGGIRALDREQVRRIYEKEVTNWKEFGGPDHDIKFFNPVAGRGVWELLATWLYGDVRKAPLGSGFETVNGGEDTRVGVEFHAGAISVVAPYWIDGRGTYALAIKSAEGESVPPSVQAVREKRYPLARGLTLVSAERPVGELKRVIDFFTGPAGKEYLRKADYFSYAETPGH